MKISDFMSKWLSKVFGEQRQAGEYAKCRRCRTRFKLPNQEEGKFHGAALAAVGVEEQYDRKLYCSHACNFPKPEFKSSSRPARRYELRMAAMAQVNKKYGPHKPESGRTESRRARREVSREVSAKWYKDEKAKALAATA